MNVVVKLLDGLSEALLEENALLVRFGYLAQRYVVFVLQRLHSKVRAETDVVFPLVLVNYQIEHILESVSKVVHVRVPIPTQNP